MGIVFFCTQQERDQGQSNGYVCKLLRLIVKLLCYLLCINVLIGN